MQAPRDDGPLDELCQFIVSSHHAAFQLAIPLIESQLAGRAGAEVREAFADLANQLRSHLAKEENLLFPAIEALAQADRQGSLRPALPFSTVLYPVRMMETEHARIEAALAHLREITEGLGLTELARLDADLHEHHRLENEMLFPRVLELERRFQ